VGHLHSGDSFITNQIGIKVINNVLVNKLICHCAQSEISLSSTSLAQFKISCNMYTEEFYVWTNEVYCLTVLSNGFAYNLKLLIMYFL